MNFKIMMYKIFQNQTRLMSSKKPKNHYASLGIPSSSTQGEVKSAYYKLSMLYHPDKTKNDSEFSQKFRDITEAYEVLGNANTRRLYDKGLYFGGARTVEDTADGFQKSRETRSRPSPSGRTPIYDFDEWSKNHYGATFQRQMEGRRRQKMYEAKRRQDLEDIKMEKVLFLFGAFFILCMYYFSHSDDYDNVTFGSNLPVSRPVQAKKD